MRARRQFVNQPRHDFLARTAFSQHQHRNVDVRNQRSLRTKLAHHRTGGDKEHLIADFFHFARIILLIGPQTLVDDRIQFALLKRLGQVIVRAQANRLHHLAGIADAREHHDFDAGLKLPQLFQRLQAVDPGHQQVEQYQVGTQTLLHIAPTLLRRCWQSRLCNRPLRAGFGCSAAFPVRRRPAECCWPLLSFAFPGFVSWLSVVEGGRSGRMKENLQPAPGSLSTQILPPMPPTRRRAMARPSPIPAWLSLCGRRKKSSNTSM